MVEATIRLRVADNEVRGRNSTSTDSSEPHGRRIFFRTWRPLCHAIDVEIGMPVRVEVEGLPPLAVFQLEDGSSTSPSDICTHGEASLSDGFVDGDEIECPWHSGRFCVRDGRATALPGDRADQGLQDAGGRRPGLHRDAPGSD